MNNRTMLRKRIISVGAFFVAIGIGFLFVEAVRTSIGIIPLAIGIGLYIASNFFRSKTTEKN